MELIEAKNLAKTYRVVKRGNGTAATIKSFFHPQYKEINAVNDVSFSIERGKIVGFIGPNGAGKSTTIKMMVGILTPTSGLVCVNGLEPYSNRQKVSQICGVVFGQRTQLWWDIPIIDTYSLLKEMYCIPDNIYKQNLSLFIEILGLGDFINTPARQLSLGQRMRADLCASLLHNPSVLYLDEPTIGLDISVKDKIRTFIKEINKEKGTTIILTTHDVSDLEKLCQDIMVIDDGRIIFQGELEQLKRINGESITIEISAEQEELDIIVKELDEYPVCTLISNVLRISFDKDKISSGQVLGLICSKHRIKNVRVLESSLETIISGIYQHQFG